MRSRCKSLMMGRVMIALAAVLLGAPAARAEPVGTIRVPESVPSLETPEVSPPLLAPAPFNGAWAKPDHHPLGVHLDNYNLTREQIEAAASTGCRLVRVAIPMEHFLAEAEPDWAVLDQVVSRLKRAGFEIMPVLTARVPVVEFYVAFCEAVATRYGATFTHYQLLDNINYSIGLSSQSYTDLVSLARTAIVLADSDARIVSGGIRGADLTYLEMLESQGALRSLDVIALSLFPPKGAIERTSDAPMSEHSLPYAADVVSWAAQRRMHVWVTSFGVSTCYNWVGVDQAEQAAMYARGALYLGWLGVERIIFASIQDSDPSGQRPAQCCGLLDISGAPKASYYALRTLNEAIKGCYHITPPFRFQGYTFQQPEADDLWVYSQGGFDPVSPDPDPLAQFQVHNLSIFGFWFYEPESEEYLLIYWLGEDPRFETLLTLNVGHIGLTPLARFILLDNAPSPVQYFPAQNFLYLPYQPVDTIPGVIRFEVNEHGRAG